MPGTKGGAASCHAAERYGCDDNGHQSREGREHHAPHAFARYRRVDRHEEVKRLAQGMTSVRTKEHDKHITQVPAMQLNTVAAMLENTAPSLQRIARVAVIVVRMAHSGHAPLKISP